MDSSDSNIEPPGGGVVSAGSRGEAALTGSSSVMCLRHEVPTARILLSNGIGGGAGRQCRGRAFSSWF